MGASRFRENYRGYPMLLPDPAPAADAAGHAALAPGGYYNDRVVHQFAVATVVWGILGMAVGVFIAAQLYWPALNFDTAWLSYGRLRPLHTNGVVFGFGGTCFAVVPFSDDESPDRNAK